MKLYHGLMKTVSRILTGILMFIVLIVTCQVFSRYVLKNPLGWSEQICRLLFLWGIMLGIPVVFYEKCDMVFDILFQKFPNKIRKTLSVIFAVLGIAFCVFYLVAGVNLCIKSGNRMTAGVIMPINVLYGAQLVCATLMGIIFAERLISMLKDKKD